jgi:hypothetical protein
VNVAAANILCVCSLTDRQSGRTDALPLRRTGPRKQAPDLSACLVRVKVRMVSYAVSYEKDISDRPLRSPVDPFAIVSAHSEERGKTPHPLLARCSRRHLLRAQKWLSLATFAPRLPSLVYRLLSFQKVPIERVVVSHPRSPACS